MTTRIYRFLTGPDTVEFCHKVTEALSQGWELHGSPSYTSDARTGEFRCGQAVTKLSEEEYHPAKKLSEY